MTPLCAILSLFLFTPSLLAQGLDYVKAHEWTHTDIARYVNEKFKIDGWWSQSVTVGYERIKGLRVIGQRRSGEFEASKSKTFNVPLSRLYAAFSEKRHRNKWLGPVDLTVGATIKNRSFRMTWNDGKPVAAWFERCLDLHAGAGRTVAAA